jgi:hypothetical protein
MTKQNWIMGLLDFKKEVTTLSKVMTKQQTNHLCDFLKTWNYKMGDNCYRNSFSAKKILNLMIDTDNFRGIIKEGQLFIISEFPNGDKITLNPLSNFFDAEFITLESSEYGEMSCIKHYEFETSEFYRFINTPIFG